MYRQNQALVALLRAPVEALGYELWGLELLPDGADSLLRLYIEHEHGITIEDCERVSHQVVGVLDVEDPIAGSYRLEVSSPGLDRPLFSLEQFARFKGERASVQLREKLNERRRVKGRIDTVSSDTVTICDDNEEWVIAEGLIDRANILSSLD